jgi:hypothetical protein
MGYKGFKGGSPHRNISAGEATWTKLTVRPCVMQKMAPTSIVSTILAGMRELEWGSCDDVKPEAINAILEVMITTDELGRGAVADADRTRAEPHESDLEARALVAAIYNVHLQNPFLVTSAPQLHRNDCCPRSRRRNTS